MELVTRTFTKDTGDDPIDAVSHTERGDIINVGPDGTDWGRCVRKNPAYLIIRVDVHPTIAISMTTPEFGDRQANPMLRKRLNFLDLAKLESFGYVIPNEVECRETRYPAGQDVDNYLKLPDRPVLEITVAHFNQARVRKSPLRNPNILGGSDPMVLGG